MPSARARTTSRPRVLVCLLAVVSTVLAVPVAASASPPAAVPCARGHVALTFDDGPGPGTAALLDALAAADARATFFLVGAEAWEDPAAVEAIAAGGHAIGNHTWSHPFLDELEPQAAYDEMLGTNQVLRDLGGTAPTLFRPPYGRTDAQIRRFAEELGMTEVLWTIDTRDYAGAGPDEIAAAVAIAEDGDVVLLHDAGYPATLAAVPRVVDDLAARGLCPGRVVPGPEQAAWEGQTYAARAGAW